MKTFVLKLTPTNSDRPMFHWYLTNTDGHYDIIKKNKSQQFPSEKF